MAAWAAARGLPWRSGRSSPWAMAMGRSPGGSVRAGRSAVWAERARVGHRPLSRQQTHTRKAPSPHNAAALPVLSIQPAARQTSPSFVFTVSLVISNVTNLGAYEATLLYDPALLQVLAITHPSPSFLAVNGRTAGAPPIEPIDLVAG